MRNPFLIPALVFAALYSCDPVSPETLAQFIRHTLGIKGHKWHTHT